MNNEDAADALLGEQSATTTIARQSTRTFGSGEASTTEGRSSTNDGSTKRPSSRRPSTRSTHPGRCSRSRADPVCGRGISLPVRADSSRWTARRPCWLSIATDSGAIALSTSWPTCSGGSLVARPSMPSSLASSFRIYHPIESRSCSRDSQRGSGRVELSSWWMTAPGPVGRTREMPLWADRRSRIDAGWRTGASTPS